MFSAPDSLTGYLSVIKTYSPTYATIKKPFLEDIQSIVISRMIHYLGLVEKAIYALIRSPKLHILSFPRNGFVDKIPKCGHRQAALVRRRRMAIYTWL
jgi:hypothetical protein